MTNEFRDKSQQEVIDTFRKKHFLLVHQCTGFGKSWPPLKILDAWRSKKPDLKCAIISTGVGISTTWPKEALKLGVALNGVHMLGWRNIHGVYNQNYDFVIVDEAHKITEANSVFFRNNTFKSVILLTGSMPADPWKLKWIMSACRGNVIKIELEEAAKYEVINQFKIVVHRLKPTTAEWAEYLKACTFLMNATKVPIEVRAMRRMECIYNMNSKLAFSNWLLETAGWQGKVLIFTARVDHACALADDVYVGNSEQYVLDNFLNGKIKWLATCEMLNESISVDDLAIAYVHQIKGSNIRFLQQLGRLLRLLDKSRVAELHVAIMKDTQEEAWLFKSTKDINKERIQIIDYDVNPGLQ